MKKANTPFWATEENFEAEVMIRKQVVLVAFLAPWSQPCREMDFTLDRVFNACSGLVKLVKVNADEHPALSLLYDIKSIPALLYFSNGIIRETVVGAVAPEIVVAKLQPLLCPNPPGPHAP